jgi:hypothetical protein
MDDPRRLSMAPNLPLLDPIGPDLTADQGDQLAMMVT